MKQMILPVALAAAFFGLGVAGASAGPVERACLASDRQAATRTMCRCIGSVADATLTGRDQRIAAKFFSDPHRAQEVRQSDRDSDEAFWTRYRSFGAMAEQSCAG